MKRLVLCACALVLLVGRPALAQDPPTPQPADEISPTPTEDMWFYLQELRRYDDPQNMVRRKAELKGNQRRQRLAAMKWFGFSPSRPQASPVPFMGMASPSWVGNGLNPNYWVGGGYTTTAVYVDKDVIRR